MKSLNVRKFLLFLIFASAIGFAACGGDSSDDGGGVATPLYIITGSGTTFTATCDSVTVGTANQPIQTVINAIRADANGANCEIQFGDGTTTLNIGTAYVYFNGTGGTWGAITLTGKITSAQSGVTFGTVTLADDISISSTADIENTMANRVAVWNNSTGTVNILDGTVQTTGSNGAVLNNSTGTVNISGGTVSNIAANGNARAVWNNSTGTVNISGGTVEANTGVAVYNNSTGKITVSGTSTVITSANVTAASGTIYLTDTSGNTGVQLEISGGTVENTSSGANGHAVWNDSDGEIRISGGEVSTVATGSRTISNNENGKITISGGIVKSAGNASVIYNDKAGEINISGGTVQGTGDGYAIFSYSTGKIIISQDSGKTTLITSKLTSGSHGTIYLAAPSPDNVYSERLTISGGTVENASTGTTGNAICNASQCGIRITGGTIKTTATGGYTIRNVSASPSATYITVPPAVLNPTGRTNGGQIYINGVVVP